MMNKWTFNTRVCDTDGVPDHPTRIVVFAEDLEYARTRAKLIAVNIEGSGLSLISVEETEPVTWAAHTFRGKQ